MKRGYINLGDKLAATLVRLLPPAIEKELRESKVHYKSVLSLFHFDHIVLHALGGSDLWWNLDPKEVAPHREKSRGDTSIVAKVVRIDTKWRDFMNAIAAGQKPSKRQSKGRKLQSRGFNKATREVRR